MPPPCTRKCQRVLAEVLCIQDNGHQSLGEFQRMLFIGKGDKVRGLAPILSGRVRRWVLWLAQGPGEGSPDAPPLSLQV